MKDNLFTGKEAQEKLIKGIDAVADAVKGTLGAAGYNGLLEHPFSPFSETTNDGVSIARAIELVDPVERMGANLMKEIGNRADKQSHDGTTTAITLAQAIIHEGMKVECSPMQLKRELEECIPIIEAALDAQKKEITVDDVGTVATISAEDPTIGNMIQEIYQKIGKDGMLFRDFSKTFSDHYELSKGIKLDAGFVSPYMADFDKDGNLLNAASYKNPKILITKQKLTSERDIQNFLGGLFNSDVKELVIFADEIEPRVIQYLVATRIKTGMKVAVVKMPILWKDWWFEDLAKMTGARIIDPIGGLKLNALKKEYLGTCENIVIDKNETFIEGIQDISEHIKALESTEGKTEEEINDHKIRIARMNRKTARYYVGALSDQALSYRKLKVEDAAGAAYQALNGGVVAGGGVALLTAVYDLPQTIGGKILSSALGSPFRQIVLNAGKKLEDVDRSGMSDSYGFNAKTGEIVDMWEANIIDPCAVVKNSVRNAISVAAQVLTVKVITHLPKPDVQYVANIQANQMPQL